MCDVHFSNVHFVLCQNCGLNRLTPPFHAFFPPLLSIASTLSELKGQAMQRYHEKQSARLKGARLCPFDFCWQFKVGDLAGILRGILGPTSTIPTEMFIRQIRQNLKSVTVKITNAPKIPFDFFQSFIATGELALFGRHTGTLVGKFASITDSGIIEEFEVGSGKNYLHPKKSPVFF